MAVPSIVPSPTKPVSITVASHTTITGTSASGEITATAPIKVAAPLPRAYQWADGSAYVNHVELVRKARGGKLTVEDFAQRVRRISQQACELLGVQVLTAHQVTLRTLANPRCFRDSREYMKEGMFSFSEEVEDFGRTPQLYGLRLVFPPNETQPNAHALRIESFHGDPRSLFLENQASFPPILVARGLEPLEQHVLEAYEFLTTRTLQFVSRFDIRLEA